MNDPSDASDGTEVGPVRYSHRDHRAFRAAYRNVGLVTGAIIALVAAALLVPLPDLPLLALVALAMVGLTSVVLSDRLIHSYTSDLGKVRAGIAVPGQLRAEVVCARDPQAEDRRTRSPHSRRPGAEGPAGRPRMREPVEPRPSA